VGEGGDGARETIAMEESNATFYRIFPDLLDFRPVFRAFDKEAATA